MNPQSNYDLHEQQRLELLRNVETTHHHNRLLNHRPQPMRFLSIIKNSLRTILKLRPVRVDIQSKVVKPNQKSAKV